MSKNSIETPKSDFDRWADKEKKRDESLKTGEGIYLKGEKNGKAKRK